MTTAIDFDALLRPRSIAVIGATERPDTWGHWMVHKLLSGEFPGQVYPINHRAKEILGQPTYPTVGAVPDFIDLAIIAIPAAQVFDAVKDCAENGVKVALVITAGFREARQDGQQQEQEMVDYARARGLRLVGPNISGIINLHYGLLAHPADRHYLWPTPISFICQGAYAISDLAAREASSRRGFGKFLHTGNEADVSVIDFLTYCGNDPETQGICLYIEGLREGRQFFEVARRIAPHKPIVVFKAGITQDGGRAAASHTASLAGSAAMYRGLFRQAGLVQAPAFEVTLSMAHALLEMPPLRQPNVGVVTLGGSWGVMLTDALVQHGLHVPELLPEVQNTLRLLGMPERASVKNPVDFGAAFGALSAATRLHVVETLLTSEMIGGVVVHGYGAPGFLPTDAPPHVRQTMEADKAFLRSLVGLQDTYHKPVLLATAMTPLESQMVTELVAEGLRFQHRLDDIAAVMAALWHYADMHRPA